MNLKVHLKTVVVYNLNLDKKSHENQFLNKNPFFFFYLLGSKFTPQIELRLIIFLDMTMDSNF